ncbi:MAG: hypothetical protein EA379_01265 [Phycisphaerales bacterium]|nr:MAG: hypothetical protein EA379_01265 [Phycisphaerales bacterium]
MKKYPPVAGNAAYEAHREAMRERSVARSRSGRDIAGGPWIHEPVDPERKAACSRDLKLFCETYFPAIFNLPWSIDHPKVLSKIERAVLQGGLFAMSMPRGSGKTTICETACLWAILYGHREFVTLIGSDEGHAVQMLDAIKSNIENNELIEEDFSECVGPVRAMEGIHQRAGGQLYHEVRTQIVWTENEIVFPTIPGSPASGSVVRVAGITGRIRGMKHSRADGTSVRPSLVLVDDPQTDESAQSPSQCAKRERVLAGAILGLAGPGKKIAGLMPMTVVRRGDLADRILDRDKHPDWQGERTKMVYSFPTNEALWTQYAQIREDDLRGDQGACEATEFYRRNREAMDEGAEVAWEARHNADELSAIQHAMNLKLRNEASFFAEYQNEPLPDESIGEDMLDAEDIAARTNSHAKGVVPATATKLTMFIDVQGKCLYWLIAAWEEDFTGYVVDYGTEPEQASQYFTLREVRRTLQQATPGAGMEGAIYAGLERLSERTIGREWKRDGGGVVRIEKCLIDAAWGSSRDVVHKYCRQSRFAQTVMPSYGRYVGASSTPFGEYKRKRGDRIGLNWRVPVNTGRSVVRHVLYDANWWKTFVHARFGTAVGDPGALTLFGSKPDRHSMYAEQMVSEVWIRTQARGRTVDEWKLRQPGLDNHLFDCQVGAAVAASMAGAVLFAVGQKPQESRRRVRLSDVRRQRTEQR